MKTLILALVLFSTSVGLINAQQNEQRKIFVGSVLHHTGDSLNGKIATLESIVDDQDLGGIIQILVREIRDGKITASHTVNVREGNILSIPFSNNLLGLTDIGLMVMKWEVGPIDLDGASFKLMTPTDFDIRDKI